MEETINICGKEETISYSINKPYYSECDKEKTAFAFFFVGFWISFITIVIHTIRMDITGETRTGYIFGAFVGCAIVSGTLLAPLGWFCYWLHYKFSCDKLKKKEQKVLDSMRVDIIYKLSEKI